MLQRLRDEWNLKSVGRFGSLLLARIRDRIIQVATIRTSLILLIPNWQCSWTIPQFLRKILNEITIWSNK